ncbi:hypothetical protein PYK79_41610 [Streptomyces sp. ID05-04B]|uniref:hypothetical protein n=1 Tax=unclassified Streptomyces TaxID=2593676 RepID=UPI000D1AD846|nr:MULTISPECIES: hypothetical protein [unclassified Streptomyces]AVV46466.1 hypothetical protein C6376_39015 [Streptomyces sp. P3]MDX5568501.1 hypothetical protein [Streptomyces sp. ID05-04B]
MTGSVQILGTGQLVELSRRLRMAGGPRLRQNTARRIRRAAEPLHADLQRAIRSVQLPGSGRRTRGGPSPTERPLRATLAGAVRISVRSGASPGARVWVDRSRLPADLRNMPGVIDEGRVRHPVFNNRKRWATQWARPTGWWSNTVEAGMPRMRAEIERVLGDVRRDLQ